MVRKLSFDNKLNKEVWSIINIAGFCKIKCIFVAKCDTLDLVQWLVRLASDRLCMSGARAEALKDFITNWFHKANSKL